jgi:taurine dioxygenase
MAGESLRTGSRSRVTVIPTGKALGAEIQGVDLRTIDPEEFANIYQAWLSYSVLLFRDQKLTDEDLVAFSKRFGDLDWAPVQESGRRFVEGHPEIYVVSNVMENLAYGYVVPAGSAEGQYPLCSGSSTFRGQHLFQQHVSPL